jgi:hypothetical protein
MDTELCILLGLSVGPVGDGRSAAVSNRGVRVCVSAETAGGIISFARCAVACDGGCNGILNQFYSFQMRCVCCNTPAFYVYLIYF